MASINKLAIRGVRSFSPDEEEQVISFCFPLTIIVGENGCGKTTIIESLKYAVTGSLPPGNKSGQSFIHDPKSVGQSTVKGQIKLRFANRAGKNMVVIRSMEVTQKKTTMSFKALDGILKTTHPETGKSVSLSHKCTELDRQIPALLGVSKAILEHVVFCHQEDSSWPLMEGAILKKRFDDIFDSTRYTKALDEITKTRKSLMLTGKDHKADLNSLASHKHAASLTREELEENIEKISEVQEDIKSYDEQIQLQIDRIEELEESEQKIIEAKEHIQQHENLIQEQEAVAASIQDLLENDYSETHTESQLKKMLHSFDHQGDKLDEKLKNKHDEYKAISQEIEILTNQYIEQKSKKARLESEKETNEQTVQKRLDLLQSISQKYNIPLPKSSSILSSGNNSLQSELSGSLSATVPTTASLAATQTGLVDGTQASNDSQQSKRISMLSSEQIENFILTLKEKKSEINEEIQQMRRIHQNEDDDLQSRISSVDGKQQSIKNDLSRIKSQQIEMERELQQINSLGSSHSRIRKSDLDAAQTHANQAAKDYKELNEHPKLQSIPKQIKEYDERLSKIQTLIEEDNNTLLELRRLSQDQNTITMLQQQVDQDLQRLEEACNENSFIMHKYNVSAVPTDITSFESMAGQIREKYESTKQEFERTVFDLNAKQKLVTEKQTLVDHTKRNLNFKQSQITQLSTNSSGGVKRINRVISGVRKFELEQYGDCPLEEGTAPLEIVKYLEIRMKEFQEDGEDSIQRTTRKIKQLYIARVKNAQDTACPCCTRSMDYEETQVFLRTMERLHTDIIALDQVKAQQNRTTVDQYNKWKTIVNSSNNDWQECNRLKNEIVGMEKAYEQGSEELIQLKSDFDDLESKKMTLETDTTELHNFFVETGRLRDDASRIADKQSQIKSKEQRIKVMAPDSGGRSLDKVESDVNSRLEEKESIMNNIASLNKDMSSLNKRIQLASAQLSNAEQTLRDKEQKYQKDQENATKKISLKENIVKLREEEEKLQERIGPLKRQYLTLTNEKERMRSSAKIKESKLSEKINLFSADMHTLSSLSAIIDDFKQSNKINELNGMAEKLSDVDAQIKKHKSDSEQLANDINTMKSRAAEQERYRKSVQDNIRLLEIRRKVQELKEECEVLEAEFEAMAAPDNSGDDYATCVKKKNSLLSEKARREGRIGELKYQQKELKKKLQTKEYKDIDERHRVKMIEYETTNIMVSDLEIYHKALDKALLQYHGIKIEDINKIIRELWTLTYKGEDIHNIKLVSGQDKGSRASRSYNYRVVMTKGNTEMDMRGRCSAGQRVLASIVIRLALAETFCLNCGVLALDEPTTNLDYENKRGLAIALAQIIANRAAQRNFQLVTITHDEDFVTMMKNELSTQTGFSMPENYFHVSREEGRDGQYYSKINAISWDDI